MVSNQKATLANLSIEGIGYEPELVGSIFAAKVGEVSAPIIGKNGVYVVQVTAKDEERLSGDFSQQKISICLHLFQKVCAIHNMKAIYQQALFVQEIFPVRATGCFLLFQTKIHPNTHCSNDLL